MNMTLSLETPVNTSLFELARGLAARHHPPEWLDWLPLAQAAADAPAQWVATFNRLDLQDQFRLLSGMFSPQGGVAAQALLLLLARHADQIEDDQARQIVLAGAAEAHEAQSRTLQALRETLKRYLPEAERRLSQDFDLAQDILRMQGELAHLREQEHARDLRSRNLHALEQEILDLAARQRILEAYDSETRTRRRDELRAGVERLEQRRRELEMSLAELRAQYDALAAPVEQLERELQQAQAQKQQAEERLNDLRQRLQEAQTRAQAAARESASLESQIQHAALQREQIEQENLARQKRLEAERQKLKELQESAARLRLVELETRVREVYGLLSDDLIDQDVSKLRGAKAQQT